MKGKGGDSVIPFTRRAPAPGEGDRPGGDMTADRFFNHVLDAQNRAARASVQSLDTLRVFVHALLDGTVEEPFAGVARAVFLSFVDAERFPLRSEFNAILGALEEGQRETLLNGFWHRGELVQILTPARIAALALKGFGA